MEDQQSHRAIVDNVYPIVASARFCDRRGKASIRPVPAIHGMDLQYQTPVCRCVRGERLDGFRNKPLHGPAIAMAQQLKVVMNLERDDVVSALQVLDQMLKKVMVCTIKGYLSPKTPCP